MKKIIDVPLHGDYRFKQWSKVVTNVNRELTTGYAFEGEFISDKAQVSVGAFILSYGRVGSRNNNTPTIALWKVLEDGSLEKVYEKDCSTEKWALETRDDIAELIGKKSTNPLEQFSIEELQAEIDRRTRA